MHKRILGFSLLVIGFGGMALAGYLFAMGSGGRGHLIEVTSYMIVGAACFFAGINYVYETANAFSDRHLHLPSELEEVSPIQQQWRTIHISKQPVKQVVRDQYTADAV